MLQGAIGDPLAAPPEAILALQKSIGNRAVSRLIQAKLTVGPAGDKYEQEADRVADQVVNMTRPADSPKPVRRQEEEEEAQTMPLVASVTPPIQRQEEEEEELQRMPLAQRQAEPEEKELQKKPAVRAQRIEGNGSFEAGADLERRLASKSGRGRPLPEAIRSEMESRFGAEFNQVRVHTDREAVQMNSEIGAQAFTHGSDVFFGAGKYSPGAAGGKRLLAHELTHVVQQGGASLRTMAGIQRSQGAKQEAAGISRAQAGGLIQAQNIFQKAGGWLKKGYQKLKKLKQKFFGRLKGSEVEEKETGTAYVDELSRGERLEHAQKTKGSQPGAAPDYTNPDVQGLEPDEYMVTLAVAQTDTGWYRNIQALKKAALTKLKGSPWQFLKKIFGGGGEDLPKDLARQVLGQQETDWEKKTKPEQENLVDKFMQGLHNVGHTWVRLSTYVGGKLQELFSFGMWPRKTFDPESEQTLGGYAGFTSAGPGEVRHPDVAHEGDATKAYYDYKVSAEGFGEALATAVKLYNSPPAYVLTGYNCTAFAREIVKKAGGAFPGEGVLPGFAYTPGNLYWAVMKEWAEGHKQAHTTDKLAGIVKQVGKEQEKRAEQAQEEAKSGHEFKESGPPKKDAREAKAILEAGKKIHYGDQPYKFDRELDIDVDMEVTVVVDQDFVTRWGAWPIKFGSYFWYVKEEDFDDAVKDSSALEPPGLNLYEYQTMSPPTTDPDVAERMPIERVKLLVAQGGDQAGWTEVVDRGDYYWVKTAEYQAILNPPQSIQKVKKPEPTVETGSVRVLTPNPEKPVAFMNSEGNAIEDLDAPTRIEILDPKYPGGLVGWENVHVKNLDSGQEGYINFEDLKKYLGSGTQSPEQQGPKEELQEQGSEGGPVKKGTYKIVGDMPQVPILAKESNQKIADLDKGARVEVVGADPENDNFAIVQFTFQNKVCEGRIPRDFLERAQEVEPEPVQEGPGMAELQLIKRLKKEQPQATFRSLLENDQITVDQASNLVKLKDFNELLALFDKNDVREALADYDLW